MRRRRTQLALFQAGDDLPLFAGASSALDVAAAVVEEPAPAPAGPAVDSLELFAETLDIVNR